MCSPPLWNANSPKTATMGIATFLEATGFGLFECFVDSWFFFCSRVMNLLGSRIIHQDSLIDTRVHSKRAASRNKTWRRITVLLSRWSVELGAWVNGVKGILVRGAVDRGSSYLNDLDAVCAKRRGEMYGM